MKTKHCAIGLLLISSLGIVAADYTELYNEAKTLQNNKNFPAALQKYEDAGKAAARPEERLASLLARFEIMKQTGKAAEGEEMLKAALDDEFLKEEQLRQILNVIAGQHLWDAKFEHALDLLKRAQNLESPKLSNVYFTTYYLMANIYLLRKNQPETAIEVMSNITSLENAHPGNLYAAQMLIGNAWEKLGNRENALKSYELALSHAKKITYKFNYSECEKKIESLQENKTQPKN